MNILKECKSIVLIGDIHVGHPAAIWPEVFETGKGNRILQNKAQNVMWEYWCDFWDRQEVDEADIIINAAESVEGYNRKEHGHDIMTTNLDEQINAFVKLMTPEIDGREYYSVNGSRYHGSDDTAVEAIIADRLGGTFLGDLGFLSIKGTGVKIMVQHKLGDNMIYKSTLLDRNSLFMSAIKSKIKNDPDVIVSAHNHQYFRVDTATRINLMLPCWKFWHPIKGSAKYVYTQPTIGGCVLQIFRSGRIDVVPFVKYPLEHLYDAMVEV